MRVNKWGVGVVLAASVLLAGCSAGASEKPADEKPTTASQEETTTSSDCPALSEGAAVDGAALGGCVADVLAETAGYAAKTTVMGIESTARYNPSEDAIESTSVAGSLVVIGDQLWVKSPVGDWQVADPNSSDPVVAGLSMGAAAVAQTDPTTVMQSLAGEFTVTGTGSRLGQEVFLVSGVVEVQGISVDVVYELTADYVPLASTSTTQANGMTVETVMEVTEWDVPQEIVAPL
ncbi:hypothetical protein [Microbacterium hydrocarbonoxydans]|uniref:hypothetical protein n=1 Tax=Microbacterium hydrocarbonoxydans TaxID=273678 RepID=UPI0013DD532C|nr:hypothetical protein [Microbacterium hydrocarbonoxydans]